MNSNHELMQFLHHTMLIELEYVLLLIGHRSGSIIQVIWLKYDDKIKDVHGRI